MFLNALHRSMVLAVAEERALGKAGNGLMRDAIEAFEGSRIRRFVDEFDRCGGRMFDEDEYAGEMERRAGTQ